MSDSDRPVSTMVEIQCLLDNVGTSELVIDLIVNTKNDRVFEESILLGIALLQGGNTQIQVSCNFCVELLNFGLENCTWAPLALKVMLRFASIFRPQISFYNQLYKQKKSEKFFKVFYDRMRLAQQEIRATVSVNMFELSSRKRDDDGEISSVRYKKGAFNKQSNPSTRLARVQTCCTGLKVCRR